MVIRGPARRNHENNAPLAEVEEQGQMILCIDDVTGKELLWQAVRQAREQELRYLRELGVYEKFDEQGAVAQIAPVDTT